MERPTRFEHFQYLGDKRTQVVHDLDATEERELIDDILRAESYLAFGPDTLVEARNRGYRPCSVCAAPRTTE